MDDEASYVRTRIEGCGTLSFNWKVSSETFYDYLYLIIDGEIVSGITGESDWSTKTITLGKGAHIVNWVYVKDYSVSEGKDAGWLDNVSWVRN